MVNTTISAKFVSGSSAALPYFSERGSGAAWKSEGEGFP
jgi:hypothetical protein